MRLNPRGTRDCKCSPVYEEHEFDDYATVYRIFCRICRKHIAWYSWLPVEGKPWGTRAGNYVKQNFKKY